MGIREEIVDFAIIGGGIAGLSVARAVSANGTTIVLERESHCGYHSTGRSAAIFVEGYGEPAVQEISRISRPMFDAMAMSIGRSVLEIRGLVILRNAAQDNEADDPTRIDRAAAVAKVPVLRADSFVSANFDPIAADIDVHAVQQYYTHGAKSAGANIRTLAEVLAADRRDGIWYIVLAGGDEIRAKTVINAAGAWAEAIGGMFGATRQGLAAFKRTAAVVQLVGGPDIRNWPMVVDATEQLYFKPESNGLFLSPADEQLTDPADVYAEDLDIAIAIDRLERYTNLTVQRVIASWAGLRTFAPDRLPVVGFDPTAPGFFWLAGQGGTGVQSAPALAALAAQAITAPGGISSADRALLDAFAPNRFG